MIGRQIQTEKNGILTIVDKYQTSVSFYKRIASGLGGTISGITDYRNKSFYIVEREDGSLLHVSCSRVKKLIPLV